MPTGWHTYTGQTASLVFWIFYHSEKRSKFPNPFPPSTATAESALEGPKPCSRAEAEPRVSEMGQMTGVSVGHEVSSELTAEHVGTLAAENLLVYLPGASLPSRIAEPNPRNAATPSVQITAASVLRPRNFAPPPLDTLN